MWRSIRPRVKALPFFPVAARSGDGWLAGLRPMTLAFGSDQYLKLELRSADFTLAWSLQTRTAG